MALNGEWRDGFYIPEPSIRTYEAQLGTLLGQRLCDGCRVKLGNVPRRMIDGKHYCKTCTFERWDKFRCIA